MNKLLYTTALTALLGCSAYQPEPEIIPPTIQIESLKHFEEETLEQKKSDYESDYDYTCEKIELKPGRYVGVINDVKILYFVGYNHCELINFDWDQRIRIIDFNCDNKFDQIYSDVFDYSRECYSTNFCVDEVLDFDLLLKASQRIVCEKNLEKNNKEFAKKNLEDVLESFKKIIENKK